MPEEMILKKEAVKTVKKRLKELLKPLGFRPYPHSSTRLVRVRETFIDEVSLDTERYHLSADYYIYLRAAPFTWLQCDQGRLWRTAKEHISTHLSWYCEIPPNGGPYYYQRSHFEAVWQDVAYVLENHILPQMEAITEDIFISRLLERSRNDKDFFLAYQTVSLEALYYPGTPETAIYGVSLWRLGKYEEGVPYLIFVRQKLRDWLAEYAEEVAEEATDHFYLRHIKMLDLLNELLALWKDRPEGWQRQAQERLGQIAADWIEYMP